MSAKSTMRLIVLWPYELRAIAKALKWLMDNRDADEAEKAAGAATLLRATRVGLHHLLEPESDQAIIVVGQDPKPENNPESP